MYLRQLVCDVSTQVCSVVTRHLLFQEVHKAPPQAPPAWFAITCPRMKALGQSQRYLGWKEYASCVQQRQLGMSNTYCLSALN